MSCFKNTIFQGILQGPRALQWVKNNYIFQGAGQAHMAPAVQSSQIVECDCACRLGFPRVSRKSTCPRSTRWQLRLKPTEDFQTRVDLGATKVTREARARGDRSDINLTAAFSHRHVKLLKKTNVQVICCCLF